MGSFSQTWTFLPGSFTNPRIDTELTLPAGAYRFEATARATLERGEPVGQRPGLLTGAAIAVHEWQEIAALSAAGHVGFIVDREGRFRAQPGEPCSVTVSAL